MFTRTLALSTAGALLAAPAALLVVAAPAHADTERSGSCGAGRYEISADREDRGFEVAVDLDGLAPGQRWRIVARHDGRRFVADTFRADREGDIEIDRFRRGTAGPERFSFRATRVGGDASCGSSVTLG